MGKVKSCLPKVLAYLSLLNKRKKQKLFISFHTQDFNYFNFFTGNVFFLGQNLLFEVFPSTLTAIIQMLGGSPQIYTTGIFMVKSLYLQAPNFLSLGTVIFSSIFDKSIA